MRGANVQSCASLMPQMVHRIQPCMHVPYHNINAPDMNRILNSSSGETFVRGAAKHPGVYNIIVNQNEVHFFSMKILIQTRVNAPRSGKLKVAISK